MFPLLPDLSLLYHVGFDLFGFGFKVNVLELLAADLLFDQRLIDVFLQFLHLHRVNCFHFNCFLDQFPNSKTHFITLSLFVIQLSVKLHYFQVVQFLHQIFVTVSESLFVNVELDRTQELILVQLGLLLLWLHVVERDTGLLDNRGLVELAQEVVAGLLEVLDQWVRGTYH